MSDQLFSDGQLAELSNILANLNPNCTVFSPDDLESSEEDDSAAGPETATDATPKYDKKDDICTICNAPNARLCSRCHSASYCSQLCQRIDYPLHKMLCRDVAEEGPRPAGHIRGIYFPVDGNKPEIIWVQIKRTEPGKGAQLKFLLPDGTDFFSQLPYEVIDENQVRCRQSGIGYSRGLRNLKNEGYAIALFCKNETQYAPNSNKSFQACLTTPESYSHPFRGPMIAVRLIPKNWCDDMTLASFRDVIDHIERFRTKCCAKSIQRLSFGTATHPRGVKISCNGERSRGDAPYVSVSASKVPWISGSKGSLSATSAKLGIAIRLWKYPIPDYDLNRGNQDAAFLMKELDPKKETWGWAPQYWDLSIGNVFALRDDGKDLSVREIEILCTFVTKDAQPVIGMALDKSLIAYEEAMETSAEPDMDELEDKCAAFRKEALDFITRENMLKLRG
ncbi:zinc finger MYND domain-containing protein [Aspergillus mulundensis]|uniref:MYND-type domain-containing protein n=1 Tax=Aspergillus mulundensis TaxID=1810919 RepID=A0A3D8SCY3_9EURO|nr:hypothetical protein DSM5745_04489 [Aspergillus mulundensis]RDW84163.1 hypothetical protein DSM5745_04489 [Aspergillus mulundensis]